MYAGRVACWPLVSHVEYASAPLRLEKQTAHSINVGKRWDRQTNGRTNRRQTVTFLRLPLDAANVISRRTHRALSVTKSTSSRRGLKSRQAKDAHKTMSSATAAEAAFSRRTKCVCVIRMQDQDVICSVLYSVGRSTLLNAFLLVYRLSASLMTSIKSRRLTSQATAADVTSPPREATRKMT